MDTERKQLQVDPVGVVQCCLLKGINDPINWQGRKTYMGTQCKVNQQHDVCNLGFIYWHWHLSFYFHFMKQIFGCRKPCCNDSVPGVPGVPGGVAVEALKT